MSLQIVESGEQTTLIVYPGTGPQGPEGPPGRDGLDAIGGTEDAVTQDELQGHIDSETPHPVYDDGPSFTLLYENAKV